MINILIKPVNGNGAGLVIPGKLAGIGYREPDL
jgi:hypothetical protein